MKTLAAALPLFLAVFIVTAAPAHGQTTDDEEDVQSESPKPAPKAKKGKGKAKPDKVKAEGGASAEAGAEFGASGDVTAGTEESGTLTGDGTEENPGAPVTGEAGTEVTTTAAVEPAVRGPYPLEYVDRPLTLHRRMTEVSLDLPNSFNSYIQNAVLAARHGVTDEFQLGLRYGAVSFVAIDGESDTFGGKTFAIEAQYQIFPWLAPHLSIPMLVDPFSTAVAVGPHMQVTLFDKLLLFGGRDLFTVRINRLIPSVTSPYETAGYVALDETETDLPSGELNINGGAAYQFQPNMAVEGRMGVRTFFDSQTDSTDRDPILFDVGLIYSSSNMIDFGGRIGWSDLNRADESFGLYAFGAFRI